MILKSGYLSIVLRVWQDAGCIRREDRVKGDFLASLPLRANSYNARALALLLVAEFDLVHKLPVLLGHSPLEYGLQLRVNGVQADSVESKGFLYLVQQVGHKEDLVGLSEKLRERVQYI